MFKGKITSVSAGETMTQFIVSGENISLTFLVANDAAEAYTENAEVEINISAVVAGE